MGLRYINVQHVKLIQVMLNFINNLVKIDVPNNVKIQVLLMIQHLLAKYVILSV
jgi:hypothetical protein